MSGIQGMSDILDQSQTGTGSRRVGSDILGQAEKEFAEKEPKTGDARKMGKHDFLKLLTTQLENQDPTDPMKDRKMVTQLAQFSELEEMTNVSNGMEDLNSGQSQTRMVQAVDFLEKLVTAKGSNISKNKDGISKLFYNLEDSVENVRLNILDKDDNIVNTEELGSKQAGEHEYDWNGRNYQGQESPDGQYSIEIEAVDENGEEVDVDTDVTGTVTGVNNQDGDTLLTLQDGREIKLTDVKEVVEPGDGG
ncbi:MAG: flagellar hook assembly protein FlgD [Thermodesulfobacteriota bacterium]